PRSGPTRRSPRHRSAAPAYPPDPTIMSPTHGQRLTAPAVGVAQLARPPEHEPVGATFSDVDEGVEVARRHRPRIALVAARWPARRGDAPHSPRRGSRMYTPSVRVRTSSSQTGRNRRSSSGQYDIVMIACD